MKVAIHHKPGNTSIPGSFSYRWIEYCKTNRIDHKLVNCLDDSILDQLKDCQYLLWNWRMNYTESQFARMILMAAESMDVNVFPNTATCWHYDDKIAQMYLLQSINAPIVKSYVFYVEEEALEWANKADFPKVFKLRKGSASANVKLVRSRRTAIKLIKKAFRKGFNPSPTYLKDFSTKMHKVPKDLNSLLKKLQNAGKNIVTTKEARRMANLEKGYVYFQDFIANNKYDVRITTIGDRSTGSIRLVRPGDFRASGSGLSDWTGKNIDVTYMKLGFEIARRIGAQSIAYDIIKDADDNPLIVEISYCFPSYSVSSCEGYRDKNLDWHPVHIYPEDAIIADLLKRKYP
jgi:glutathione synthase/RimK-type ligase-like ATP-grasp enzyme